MHPSEIYLLGDEDNDTDEYDRHVVIHELGHYLQDAVSRIERGASGHSQDPTDFRLAFAEGWATAWSAMVTGDPVFRDSIGPRQHDVFLSPVEDVDEDGPLDGWFSEDSIKEIVYDLFDANADVASDTLHLGLGPIYEALVDQRDAPALTSIFSFVAALKADRPGDAAAIDQLVGDYGIDPVADAFGTGETHDGDSPDALPIYKPLTVDGAPARVCSGAPFGSGTDLGVHAFVRFTAEVTGPHRITATATDVPDGQTADPDMYLYKRGLFAWSESKDDTAPFEEVFDPTPTLVAGEEYVIDVDEYGNTSDSPIGRICFDVTVERP